MDFFGQQQQARRRTALLIALFCCAVAIILMLVNLLFMMLIGFEQGAVQSVDGNLIALMFTSELGLMVSGAVLLVISIVVLAKWLGLRGGGSKIAESLGGVRVPTNTQDRKLRQLLNVVEEVSLAANMVVPPVYILEHESSINAFAAGNCQRDAVIGITRGSLEHLNRDQLQGVVAHEFSHILNGDMRLNLRLIAVLSGITFISQMGDFFIHGSAFSRRSRDNKAGLVGFGLLIIGAVGSFFAHLIKAAVNRQREYLADAAAVQFTRNPSGIADALKLIGAHSSSIRTSSAAQTSHMFFGSYKRFSDFMASHPPLPKRIRAIEPNWDGRYAATVLATKRKAPDSSTTKKDPAITPRKLVAALPVAAVLLEQLSTTLQQQAHEPADAAALALGLINPETIPANSDKPLCLRQRLSLLQLLLPTLTQLSSSQAEQLRQQLKQRWQSQSQQQTQQLQDWGILQMMLSYLGEHSATKRMSNKQASADLLSLLAIHGSDDKQEQQRAFYRGANSLGMYQLKFQNQVDWQQAAADFQRLAHLAPPRKKRLLLAFQRCAEQDNHINDDEMALLHCMSLLLDAPPLESE